MACSAKGSLSTTTPSLSKMTNFQGEPLIRSTLPGPSWPRSGWPLHVTWSGPYTFGMSTEDDLKRLGQAAAALAGVAAGRAKQVAEQLLAPHEKTREEAKHRAGGFVEEGRHAAADVVSALRREAAVILRDLEHLEQALRSREGGTSGTTTARTALEASELAPATKTATAKKSAPQAKAAPRKAAGTKTPGSKTAKKTTAQAKSAGPRKS